MTVSFIIETRSSTENLGFLFWLSATSTTTSSKTSRALLRISKCPLVKDTVKEYKGVTVDSTHGLTVAYAKKVGAKHLIRGLRAVTDFEYEFSLADANRFIDSSIDMVFFMANPEHSYISSSAIDDMHKAHVDISKLVPESVIKMYEKK